MGRTPRVAINPDTLERYMDWYGLDASDLARVARTSEGVAVRWLTGELQPTYRQAQALAARFGVGVPTLMRPWAEPSLVDIIRRYRVYICRPIEGRWVEEALDEAPGC